MLPKWYVVLKALIFLEYSKEWGEYIIVEIVDEDGVGGDGQLSDVVVHELVELWLRWVLADSVENNTDELFVEFFVSDFDLLDDVEEVGLFGVVEDVSEEEELLKGGVIDVNNAVM